MSGLGGWLVSLMVASMAWAEPGLEGGQEPDGAEEPSPRMLWVVEARIRMVHLELMRSRAVARGERSPYYAQVDAWALHGAGTLHGGRSRGQARQEVDGVIRRASGWMDRTQARLHEVSTAVREEPARAAPQPVAAPKMARLEAELRQLEIERDVLRARLQLEAQPDDLLSSVGALAAAEGARARLRAEQQDTPPAQLTRATTTAPSP